MLKTCMSVVETFLKATSSPCANLIYWLDPLDKKLLLLLSQQSRKDSFRKGNSCLVVVANESVSRSPSGKWPGETSITDISFERGSESGCLRSTRVLVFGSISIAQTRLAHDNDILALSR